jgi:hypothetical protein
MTGSVFAFNPEDLICIAKVGFPDFGYSFHDQIISISMLNIREGVKIKKVIYLYEIQKKIAIL